MDHGTALTENSSFRSLTLTIAMHASSTVQHVFFCAVFWLMLNITSAATAQDWPRLLGAEYDGVAPASELNIDWEQAPKHVWTIGVGDGYGLGSVVDGNYFQMDAQPAANGIQERIRCFDLDSGKLRWEQSQPVQYRDLYGYESGPRGTPAINGDKVVTFGVAGQLRCRSISDGSLLWNVDTNKQYGVVQNFFGVGSSPLILDDQVIVMVGGSPAEDARIAPGRLDRVSPNGTALVSFNLDDGKERWRSGDDLASYSSPRPMKIDGKTVVLAFARTSLLAIDAADGKLLWKYDHRAEILESVNAMVPVVSGNQVFISECYDVGSVLLEVSLDQAKVVWSDPPSNRRLQSMRVHWSTPILIDGFLYGCSGRNAPDSDFRCIEFATGKVMWSDDRRTRSSITRVGDILVLLEERGELQFIRPNPEKLEVLATINLATASNPRSSISYPCWAAPIIVGDKLIVRGDQKVICMSLETK